MANTPKNKKSDQLNPACTKIDVIVHAHDLPLSCPMQNSAVWNAHPRVFLPIEEVGEVVCPYCGTAYRLANFEAPAAPLKILPEKKISAKTITPNNNNKNKTSE